MKKCPSCLEQKGNFTKEHLPFKALYKGLDVKDNPAIIKICRDCNQTKSIWDQEILALYGHIFNIETLQHTKYTNIFGLGDVAALPTAKTGAAIRKQVPVVVANLLQIIKSDTITSKNTTVILLVR